MSSPDDRGPRYRAGLARASEAVGQDNMAAFLSSLKDVCPALGDYIVEFIFGDLHSRSELDGRQREMLTLGILAALGGCERELGMHIRAALGAGLPPVQVVEALLHVSAYAGFPRALNAIIVAKDIFGELGVSPIVATLFDGQIGGEHS